MRGLLLKTGNLFGLAAAVLIPVSISRAVENFPIGELYDPKLAALRVRSDTRNRLRSGKLRPSVRPGTLPHSVVQPDDVRNAVGNADVLSLAAAGMLDPGIGVSYIVADTSVKGDRHSVPAVGSVQIFMQVGLLFIFFRPSGRPSQT